MSTETDPEILHHYCSNDAFLKIVGGNSIWLSDLSLSNDSMEGRLAKIIVIKGCASVGVSDSDRKNMVGALDRIVNDYGVVGFSLSERADTLSQWRGYADNGAGVSIGFGKKYLDSVIKGVGFNVGRVSLLKISYVSQDQDVNSSDLRSAFTGHLNIFDDSSIVRALYASKNAAFAEEAEWRVLAGFVRRPDVLPAGDEDTLQFRATHDRIIPYRTLELTKTDQPAIKQVILGPRNITPISVVEGFLAKHGHENVEVIPSTASYR